MEKELERKRLEEQSLALAEVHSQLRELGTGLRRLNICKNSSALVPYSLTPRNKIAKKAMLEIEKIKLTFKEKEEIRQNEEKQYGLKVEHQKQTLKKKLDKRMIEHGINYRNSKESIHNIIFNEGKV